MANKGFSHIGLATRNLDETKEFYENILGFKTLLIDVIEIQEGGRIRHLIMDAGRDQVVAFMEARDVPGIPGDYDAGINRGLGLPNAFYHVAFEAGSEGALRQKREELIRRGVKVTEIVDHDFAKSIYFKAKLDQTLHNLGVNSLVVCGLTTAVCVTQTARETADRGFRVIVAEDACTEMSEEMHKAALLTFGYVFGRVRRTDEIVTLLGAAQT